MPTVQQLLDDVDARLPNQFTATQKIRWMNDCQNEIWRYMASTEMYQFDIVSGQDLYSMAGNMRIDMIKSVQISNSTVIDGTETYTTYTYAGPDDEMSGNMYYDALGQLGLYPSPTTDDGGKKGKVIYEYSPVQLSTATLNTTPDINTEYQDILKFRCMKVIAQSGNSPDVVLANNFQIEEDTMFNKIKMDFYKRKSKNPRKRWSYKEGW